MNQLNEQCFRKKLEFGLALILLAISACTIIDSEDNDDRTSSTELTVHVTEEAMSSCKIISVNLNELVPGKKIVNYFWSKEKSKFYIESDGQWWAYLTQLQKLNALNSPENVLTRIPLPVEQRLRLILGENYDSIRYSSSLSPSGERLLYWLPQDPILIKTPNQNPADLLPNENFPETSSTNFDVILIDENVADPIHLGTVQGSIVNVNWFVSEEKAILELSKFSPNYLWITDLTKSSLVPILSASEVSDSSQVALLDISYDGQWILYQASFSDYLIKKNIINNKTQVLSGFPKSIDARWLPDGERILAILNKDSYDSVQLYNPSSNTFTIITSNIHQEATSLILEVSNEAAVVATIMRQSNNSYEIDLLHLCF